MGIDSSKKDLMTKGTTLYGLQRYEEALSVFEQVIQLDANDPDGWNGKGIMLEELRRYGEALATYDQLILLSPTNAYGWDRKAGALLGLQHYQEALACYEQALSNSYQSTTSHTPLDDLE